jgi:hypothetical protein
VRKYEGRIPLGRLRLRWEDNIKINLEVIDCKLVYWTDVAHDIVASFRAYGNDPSRFIKFGESCD